jgi:hemolysin activation/secretion protein
MLSWGIDVAGATLNAGDIPDGRFVAWLGQLQVASRLPWLDAQILTRFEVQLSNDPLLPLEQLAVGGRYTVRGYRENTLVRDNGLAASLELRVPLFQRSDPAIRIEMAPFVDIGRSWNDTRSGPLEETTSKTLASVGLGARMMLGQWGFGELYWGHRFMGVTDSGESDLQDDGIHFRISLNLP